MNIIGAGLAGLLAGNILQRARIFESGSESQINHKAVLRFRTNAVGDATGIEFRKVVVHKGIWSNERFQNPSIRLANLYSQKAIDRLADRSIWKTEPAERFIAPENLVEQMAERCASRIEWNFSVDREALIGMERPVVSTIPMNVLADMLGIHTPKFNYAPIRVKRWHVPGADVFQTIYFPDPSTTLYRASITGSLLIAEYRDDADEYDFFPAFGLSVSDTTEHDSNKQRYGKISPLADDQWRRNFIYSITKDHGIYSLGRFATWRNLLLDDVLHDTHTIKKLMSSDNYSQHKHANCVK